MSAVAAVIKRDLRLAFRRRGDILNVLVFFFIAVSLFPFGVGPEPTLLSTMAPGIIWVAALLATLLSLDALFRSDFEDGSLAQMLISPTPMYALVAARIFAHWLAYGLPLVLLSPLLGALMHLPDGAYGALFLSLLLGTPSLSLIGATGIALTVGLRKGGVLLSLLVLPLYIPVLIFGASAVIAAGSGFQYSGQLAYLAAILVVAMMMSPFATAAALRISVN